MATSMLSLFATVLVLTLHYHDLTVPVPSWLRKLLLPSYTAKNEGTINNANDINGDNQVFTVNDVDIKKLEEKDELSKAAVMQITILYNMWQEMKTSKNTGCKVRCYQEWKIIAKRLDRMFLYLIFFLTILINVVLLSML